MAFNTYSLEDVQGMTKAEHEAATERLRARLRKRRRRKIGLAVFCAIWTVLTMVGASQLPKDMPDRTLVALAIGIFSGFFMMNVTRLVLAFE